MELLPLQMHVEPVQDVLQALDPMPGSARAGQLVRLPREADHHDRAAQVLQGPEHLLAAGRRRRAVVGLPLDEHERCLDRLHVGERGAGPEIVRLLPRRAAEPGRLEQREVRREPPGRPVGDRALRDGRREPFRVPDQPVGEDPAAAPPRDAEPLVVDGTAPDHLVHPRQEIESVVPRVAVLDDVAELLPVGRAAARVRVQHDVATGGHHLELVEEIPAVGGVRPAVNVEDERIFLRGVEIGGLQPPRLDFAAVEAGVLDRLGLAERQRREQLLVDVGQPGELAVPIDQEEIAETRRRRDQRHDPRAVRCCAPGRHLVISGRDHRGAAGPEIEPAQVAGPLVGDRGDDRAPVGGPERRRAGRAARRVLVAHDPGADLPVA